MASVNPEVQKDRFSLTDSRLLLLYGIWKKDASVLAELEGKPLETTLEESEELFSQDRFDMAQAKELMNALVTVKLPELTGTVCVKALSSVMLSQGATSAT